jgi:hypothetical protein
MSHIKPPGSVAKGMTGATTAAGARGNLGAAAAVEVLRLDGTQPMTADLPMGSHKVTGLADGTSDTDAISFGQAKNLIQGLSAKNSCRAATTGVITAVGTQTIDGVALNVDDRVLRKNEVGGILNGIWVVAAGAWARAIDFDDTNDASGTILVPVEEGTVNGGTVWISTAAQGYTIGVTNIPFVQMPAAQVLTFSNGLQKIGNDVSVLANGTTINVSSSGIKVSDTYAGNTSLGTLGTVTVGIWTGTKVDIPYGGTNATTAGGARSNLATAPSAAIFWVGSANGELANAVIPSSGTGISVTAATGVIAVDTTVVWTTTNSVAATNKTLTAPTINSPLLQHAQKLKTASYNPLVTDDWIKWTITSGAAAIMPAVAGATAGRIVSLKNSGGSTANLTVSVQSGEKLDDVLNDTAVILPGDQLDLMYDGVGSWDVVN